jgi:hypothetical protein
VSEKPDWKIQQPPVAQMMYPVRCMHCRGVYSLTHVQVTARYADCSVWTSPCCGVRGIDDRPLVRDRHYREISKTEATGGRDFYDAFGIRHRGGAL